MEAVLVHGLWAVPAEGRAQCPGEELGLKRKLAADPDDAIWTGPPCRPNGAPGWPRASRCSARVFRRDRPDRHLQRRLGGGQGKQDGPRRGTSACPQPTSGRTHATATTRRSRGAAGAPTAAAAVDAERDGMGLHFGEAVVHRDFSQMREDTGDCRLRDCPIKPQSTELVPIYSHTADEPPCPSAPARRRGGGESFGRRHEEVGNTLTYEEVHQQGNCRQLKIRPMPLAMHETREVVSPPRPSSRRSAGWRGSSSSALLVHSILAWPPLGRLLAVRRSASPSPASPAAWRRTRSGARRPSAGPTATGLLP